MKKLSVIVSLVTLIGIICSNMVASWYLLSQPETPSILSK
jgi:hypothetical protein